MAITKSILIVIFSLMCVVGGTLSPYTISGVSEKEVTENQIDITLPEYEDVEFIDKQNNDSDACMFSVLYNGLDYVINLYDDICQSGNFIKSFLNDGKFLLIKRNSDGRYFYPAENFIFDAFLKDKSQNNIDINTLIDDRYYSISFMFSYSSSPNLDAIKGINVWVYINY